MTVMMEIKHWAHKVWMETVMEYLQQLIVMIRMRQMYETMIVIQME